MFLVILVLAVLAAIGVFAVRSASLVDRASGQARQSLQTVGVAELGARGAIARVMQDSAVYINAMKDRENCWMTRNVSITPPPKCYSILADEVNNEVGRLYAGTTLFQEQQAGDAGSLGPRLSVDGSSAAAAPAREGTFRVELTSDLPMGAVDGHNADGERMSARLVTFTAIAQVRTQPATTPGNNWCSEGRLARSASISTLRAHVSFPVDKAALK